MEHRRTLKCCSHGVRVLAEVVQIKRPETFTQPTKAHVKLFFSDTRPGQEVLHAELHAAGTPFHAEIIPGQTPWREDEDSRGGIQPFQG